ncbi:hypothetical protein J6590_025678 [Homalodisca vitripennis]|nr:hypothetical protein J6590_025678 [Homalodisca vitripennis]
MYARLVSQCPGERSIWRSQLGYHMYLQCTHVWSVNVPVRGASGDHNWDTICTYNVRTSGQSVSRVPVRGHLNPWDTICTYNVRTSGQSCPGEGIRITIDTICLQCTHNQLGYHMYLQCTHVWSVSVPVRGASRDHNIGIPYVPTMYARLEHLEITIGIPYVPTMYARLVSQCPGERSIWRSQLGYHMYLQCTHVWSVNVPVRGASGDHNWDTICTYNVRTSVSVPVRGASRDHNIGIPYVPTMYARLVSQCPGERSIWRSQLGYHMYLQCTHVWSVSVPVRGASGDHNWDTICTYNVRTSGQSVSRVHSLYGIKRQTGGQADRRFRGIEVIGRRSGM